MIAVIDYGMGNLRSVSKALEAVGGVVKVTNDPKDLAKAEKIVLPGVGAFGDAVKGLKKYRLFGPLIENIIKGKPYLGICLGMQLLLDESEEAPGIRGFGLIRGMVKRFPKKHGLKVPHMGWNSIKIKYQISKIKNTRPAFAGTPKPKIKSTRPSFADTPKVKILRGIADGAYMYFVHSYYPAPEDKSVVAAETEYGVRFPSMFWKDNIYAMQFHPEKSQGLGLLVLKNFVKLC